MPTFDITSEFNNQEITNAVDQAYREIANRYDFRDTGTSIAFNEKTIVLKSSTEERLNAAEQVLKEKFVKRNVSIKFLSDVKIEKTPSETTMKSTRSFVLSLKLIKSFSLICEIFFTSFPNLRLFANNLFFKNSIKTDLFKVVYLNSSELNLDRFKSQIL